MCAYAFFGVCLVSVFLLSSANTIVPDSPQKHNLLFIRDSTVDGLLPDGPDDVEVAAVNVLQCSLQCGRQEWCTSLSYVDKTGSCYLHATAFLKSAFKRSSEGAVHFTNIVDRCPRQELMLYNRLADMCVYFEQDKKKFVKTLNEAADQCSLRQMHLAQKLSPLEMEAILNFTRRNLDLYAKDYFVGMMLGQLHRNSVVWLDYTTVNRALLKTYSTLGSRIPAPPTTDTCGYIRPRNPLPLNIKNCRLLHPYICELLLPDSNMDSNSAGNSFVFN